VYSLLPSGFVVGGLASGICGSGIGGGIFKVREISTDSINTTLEIDCTITGSFWNKNSVSVKERLKAL
jgi:hypothetical protein